MTPADIGIASSFEHPDVWGLVMDMWVGEGTVTLVSLVDGSTSLYFFNGGGIIGAGDSELVADASIAFVIAAEHVLDRFAPADGQALPDSGTVRFNALGFDGTRTADAHERDLECGSSPLTPLYAAGQDVITVIREQGLLE